MKYKVEFENNQPVRAAIVNFMADGEQRVAFETNDGKTTIKHLYLEAESKDNAIEQASEIIATIFKS